MFQKVLAVETSSHTSYQYTLQTAVTFIPKTESFELPLNIFSVAFKGAVSREFMNKDFFVVAL